MWSKFQTLGDYFDANVEETIVNMTAILNQKVLFGVPMELHEDKDGYIVLNNLKLHVRNIDRLRQQCLTCSIMIDGKYLNPHSFQFFKFNNQQ